MFMLCWTAHPQYLHLPHGRTHFEYLKFKSIKLELTRPQSFLHQQLQHSHHRYMYLQTFIKIEWKLNEIRTERVILINIIWETTDVFWFYIVTNQANTLHHLWGTYHSAKLLQPARQGFACNSACTHLFISYVMLVTSYPHAP